jgi:geranylgeranyl pyrophosphate synthase
VAVQLLAEAALDLARGEALQVEQTRRPETAVEDYLARCRLKTARLFVAACALGARLGGLGERDQQHLAAFGMLLGLAFQLADDALDCDGDPQITGKALGTDVLDGTMTLPLLLAAGRDPEVARTMREGVDGQGALPTLARVIATGAVRETRARAVEFAAKAEQELAETSSACDARTLRVVLRRAVEREA